MFLTKRSSPTLVQIFLLGGWLWASALPAAVSLPKVFTDNMVLQQATQANVWGWADPGESVTVTGSWDGQAIATTADSDGNWKVSVATPAADSGTHYTLTVRGALNTVTLENVLIGEVWLVSGQSNMEMTLRGWPEANPPVLIEGGPEAIRDADYPGLRLFIVSRQATAEPARDTLRNGLLGEWTASHPSDKVHDFSAVGFFFGRQLHEELGLPIGLIQSTRGASSAEAWTPRADLEMLPGYAGQGPWIPSDLRDRGVPTTLYNGMIAPLTPFTIRGVIWYQGEENVGRAEEYAELFPTLIQSWRREWGQGDLPFYFVQLAPYNHYTTRTALPELWEAQGSALYLPNTGMASALDAGNPNDIHPGIKQPVGERLARLALARTYGQSLTDSGPQFIQAEEEGSSIRIHFDHVGSGLQWAPGGPDSFEIAGVDGRYYPANARIEGETVIVEHPQVPDPVEVRYAWSDRPVPALYNREGMPAPAFRTDAPDYLPSILGVTPAPPTWNGLPIREGTHVWTDGLGWFDIRSQPWIFSQTLSTWLFMPDDGDINDGAWAWFTRTAPPDDPSLPQWAGYPVADGHVFADGFLDWLGVEDAPWVYSHAFDAWIFILEDTLGPSGSWGYLVP